MEQIGFTERISRYDYISAYFYAKSTDLISVIPHKFNKFRILKNTRKKQIYFQIGVDNLWDKE